MAIQVYHYTYIYHLAAVIGVQHVLKSPYDVLDQNFILLKNALNIAKKQQKLERFVFTSTSEVYSGTLHYYGLEFPTSEITPLTVNDINEASDEVTITVGYGTSIYDIQFTTNNTICDEI